VHCPGDQAPPGTVGLREFQADPLIGTRQPLDEHGRSWALLSTCYIRTARCKCAPGMVWDLLGLEKRIRDDWIRNCVSHHLESYTPSPERTATNKSPLSRLNALPITSHPAASRVLPKPQHGIRGGTIYTSAAIAAWWLLPQRVPTPQRKEVHTRPLV